jgi:hypothetical protein
MVIEYECRKCKKVFSWRFYEKCKFCPDCETRLRMKILKIPVKPKMEKIEIKSSDINLDALFYKYINFKPVDVGGGLVFPSVTAWISARCQAYKTFRKVFSSDEMTNADYVLKKFKEWLLFRNNLSWTTLHRTGYQSLNKPDRLVDLLIYLQDSSVSLEKKVWHSIKGKYSINGIGQGIITALLHTFDNEKNCVWNSRTIETLDILRRPPKNFVHVGKAYVEVNKIVQQLANELSTDLTTIDGFMWFISKWVKIL